MLTRLQVHGFKNLLNVDVSLGPFTCVAGVNGVGKSNLFDAITFLSAVADRPLMEAAAAVRDEENRSTTVRSLFTAGPKPFEEMSFTAEMIVPPAGIDDLGQPAKAAITFLRYRLVLGLRESDERQFGERLCVMREELTHINLGDAKEHLGFDPAGKWIDSVVRGARRGGAFVSTEREGDQAIIKLHQDSPGKRGRAREALAINLPRTVLSSANAGEGPTVLLARREMQSWRLLQLETSALRSPDAFNSPTHIGANGAHLASTLRALSRKSSSGKNGSDIVAQQVANRLSELVENIAEVRVDEDAKRELLTLEVVDRNQTPHAARALSDGTLRFLALSILEQDPEARGLLCFEEPENGIHPQRIEAMLRLLKDLSVDPEEEVGPDNPLRQVIVNTHSPSVVALVDDADLLIARPSEQIIDEIRYPAVTFSWLSDTWRARANPNEPPLSRGVMGAYLNPFAFDGAPPAEDNLTKSVKPTPNRNGCRRRVKDRIDLQGLLNFPEEE